MKIPMKDTHVNELKKIHTLIIDSIKGYKLAGEKLKSDDLKNLALQVSEEREWMAKKVERVLTAQSEETEGIDDQDFKATLHRSWMELKTSLTQKDDQVVLESCRNGDRALLEAFDDALQGELLYDDVLKTFLMDLRYRVNDVATELDNRYFSMFKQEQ